MFTISIKITFKHINPNSEYSFLMNLIINQYYTLYVLDMSMVMLVYRHMHTEL